MKVGYFIKTNTNTNVKWNINGTIYTDVNDIPDNLKEGYVLNWQVNQWEGIILILVGKYNKNYKGKLK